MTPGLLTAVLYTSYLLASALPMVSAAAHQEQAAIRGAAGFHAGDTLPVHCESSR
ncbi:hypothetical protein ACH41H_24760 [Streptomyces sp. NPDC020800]|uniref:hypothetical protein n=1 Tax=Streptomyces sp. NPDC020800 TaxID=3365092 RepID=UPI00379FDF52